MTLEQQIAQLKAENDALRAKASAVSAGGLSVRVSKQGAVSVYGLGRFPVTLYKSQFLRLLDQAPAIRKFIAENDAKLSEKAKTAREDLVEQLAG